ncbi:hypothetical protein SAMN05920897_11940 [Alkalispirochaeta americana]|uniref:Uncharacterized protein n=1 Tax=Alkalispirochaeta americana TaxID=159291 RepID=A0A1N6WYG0_9SPIO|nr:hypothetical protein [Alkalispirochaeta americana]SIQ95164.1 hypothetical protein SAMN05920897_11940 [Alkalispirochaeta americana]
MKHPAKHPGSILGGAALLLAALILTLITLAAILEFSWSSRVERQLTHLLKDQGAQGTITFRPREGVLRITDLSWPLQERTIRLRARSVEFHMQRGELLRKLIIDKSHPLSGISLHLKDGQVLRDRGFPKEGTALQEGHPPRDRPLMELKEARVTLEGSLPGSEGFPGELVQLLQGTPSTRTVEELSVEGNLQEFTAHYLPGGLGELALESFRFSAQGSQVTTQPFLSLRNRGELHIHLEGSQGNFHPGQGFHDLLNSRWAGLSDLLPRREIVFSRTEVKARREDQTVTLEKGYLQADRVQGTLSGSAALTGKDKLDNLQGSLTIEDLADDLRRLAAPVIFVFTRGGLIPRRGPFTLSFNSRGLSLH